MRSTSVLCFAGFVAVAILVGCGDESGGDGIADDDDPGPEFGVFIVTHAGCQPL